MFIELELMNNKQDYLDYISNFFTTNYAELFSIAKKDTINTDFSPEDILSELYVYLIDNKSKILELKKIEGKEDRVLTRYAAQWIYNNIRLFSANAGQSNFQSKFSNKKEPDYDVDEHLPPSDNHHIAFSIEKDIWLTDNLSSTDQKRIKIIDDILNNKLTEAEKRLYNMIYVQNLNVPKIREQIPSISKYSIYKMINAMNEKITKLLKQRMKVKKKNVYCPEASEKRRKQNQEHYQKHKDKIKRRVYKNRRKAK